jgi:hypothetical protein
VGADWPLFVSKANKSKKLLGVENSEKQAIPPLKVFFLSLLRYFLKKCLVFLFYAFFQALLNAQGSEV